MGLFSSITKPLTSALSGIGNLIGGTLNDVTGVTSSAKQAQEYTQQNMNTSQGMTLEQMAKSNEYSKEQMALENQYYLQQLAQNYNYQVNSAKNAIQWQMQDLKKAGLNPILAAGYGGANLGGAVGASGVSTGGASGSMGTPSGSTGTSGANPIELIQSISTAKKTLAEAKLAETKELGEAERNGWITPQAEQSIKESKSRTAQNTADANLKQKQAYNEQATWYKIKEETDAVFWNNIKNKSDAEFIEKYGVSKDQAIKIAESAGKAIGQFIKRRKK